MADEYTESIERVLKDILPQLPGVIRSVAANECRLAMREFFERSLAWTTIVQDVSIPSGDTPIQIDTGDENSEVIAILKVRHGNDTDGYQPVTPFVGEPDLVTSGSNPDGWYVTSNPDELKLHPHYESETTNTLRVTVGLIPSEDIAINELDLPRQIGLKFKDAILNGTLSRLYSHPNKPYTQPVSAHQLRVNFLRQIGYYAAQRKKGFNNSPSWRHPRGWSPKRRY